MVVGRFQEADVQMRLECGVLPAQAVELGDFADDIAWPVPVPRAKLVFLAVDIFFLAPDRIGFAQLKPVIDTP